MSFTATQIQFLQRLLSDRPRSRRGGEVASFFSEHYSLGVAVGRNIEYREADYSSAAALLTAHDLPTRPLGVGASRSEASVFGGISEKMFSVAPHASSVAIKLFGGCSVDGSRLSTPAGGYLVCYPELALKVGCDRILLVENLETFRRLEDYRWIDLGELAVLAIFRGDPTLSTGLAMDVIQKRTESVWAFVDFDPAGLAIANSIPGSRLERVLLPNLEWLRASSDSERGRQLFADQVGQYRAVLTASSHPELQMLWRLMCGVESAVTQERMQAAPG